MAAALAVSTAAAPAALAGTLRVQDDTHQLSADGVREVQRAVGDAPFDGRLLVVGFTSGRIPSIGVNIPLIKGFSVMGVRAGEYGRRFPARGRENIVAIDGLLADGKLHPHIGARFALAHAVDAMRMLKSRNAIGKVVIVP